MKIKNGNRENFKILYVMGGSGCGKTTLAKRLEEFDPINFKRTLELATRDIRDDEVDGFDYKFVSKDKFIEIENSGELFESVKYQFEPNMYGAMYSDLYEGVWNVVIVSIEGLLSSIGKIEETDRAILLNIINDVPLDIAREGRDPKIEENFNKAVLASISISDFEDGCLLRHSGGNTQYRELKLSKLKEIRNDKKALLSYINSILED